MHITLDQRAIILPRLPSAFDGLRIAFVSDIHIRRSFPLPRAEALAQMIASFHADMLLMGGDYAESAPDALAFAQMLEGISPKLGIYGVLGNNDRECFPQENDIARLKTAFARSGATLLVNEQVRITERGQTILIAGLDELKHGAPDLNGALHGVQECALGILLCHYPQLAVRAVHHGRECLMGWPDIALCGHTHGGQWAIGRVSAYTLGFERALGAGHAFPWRGLSTLHASAEPGVPCLISNGVGTSLFPLRIGAQPEIHLITLRAAKPKPWQ